MKKHGNRKSEDVFQSFLDADTSRRLERVVSANDFLVAWREKHLGSALELERSKAWAKKHVEAINRLAGLIRKGAEQEEKGRVAGREYWRKEVIPAWHQAFGDKVLTRVGAFHAKHAGALGGYERDYIAGLLGVGKDIPFEFVQRYKKNFGAEFWQDESTPDDAAQPQPDDDVGVVQQGVNTPFTRCTPAPYPLGGVSKADSGPAINVSSAGVSNTDGSGFLSVMTLALVAMGGGSAATGIVGIDSAFPPGFSTLSVSATIDLSFAGRSMTVLGGATASINLTITAVLPDGRRFSAVRLVKANSAPLFWFSEVNEVQLDQVIELKGIDLQGIAGPVRVFAGVQVFSAGVGVVGSSGARMDASFIVKQICVSLE